MIILVSLRYAIVVLYEVVLTGKEKEDELFIFNIYSSI